ncbi:MAG: electron transfer flavoprotein subunit beta/FixA family protein [Thermodesulfobacteriota bacterium]|nr:electron transfer flavoprotein subunit beta/FixA family protein [Thermodesulfobacteriota bacterium]
MNIVVCLKPAPDPKRWDSIQLDPVTKALKREGIPSVLGHLDKRALEEGLRIKEKHGGKVAVMAMAPPAAKDNLLEALAMGADEGYLLSDRAFAGSDTWATSLVLSRAIKKLGSFDLILCGSYSLDGSTGHVGAQLAEFLGVLNVTQVAAVESITEGALRTKSLMERGYRILETLLPALITVNREINTPRFTSLLGIIEAESKPLITWSAADLGITGDEVGLKGSPTQTGDVFLPEMKRQVEMISGEPEEMIKVIIRKIRQAIG